MRITVYIAALAVILSLAAGCEHHGHHHDHDHEHDHEDHHEHHHVEGNHVYSSTITPRSLSDMCVDALIASAMTSIAPIAVVPLVSMFAGGRQSGVVLHAMSAFAAGALIGDVFLHFENDDGGHDHHHHEGHDNHDHHEGHEHVISNTAAALLAGFAVFYFLDGLVATQCGSSSSSCSHSRKGEETDNIKAKKSITREETESFVLSSRRAVLSLLADAAHNFADGLVLGVSAVPSRSLLFQRTAVLVAHELPHEVGDYVVLAGCGWSTFQVILSQFATALGNAFGCITAVLCHYYLGDEWMPLNIVESFVGGSFLYVGCVVLIGDLSRSEGSTLFARSMHVVCFMLGVRVITLASVIEGWLL